MSGSARNAEGRFINPAWMAPQAPPRRTGQARFGAILRWRLGKTREAWPGWVVDPAPAGDPNAEPGAGQFSITFIGHSCFLIRLPGLVVITDPMFSLRASPFSWAGPRRARAPGRALASLPPVDLVLLSHNHYDHLDLPSLRALHAHSDPLIVTPLGNGVTVRKSGTMRIRELDWWQETTLDQPIAARIIAVPARHFSARTPRDSGRALWAGFMLEAGGVRLLFAGDSGDGTHWQAIGSRLGAPDLALLPIGAYAPRSLMGAVHIDPDEAVRAHLALGARRSLGMHFGTFQLTDEAIDAPERALQQAKSRHGMAADAFSTLAFGECRIFDKGMAGETNGGTSQLHRGS